MDDQDHNPTENEDETPVSLPSHDPLPPPPDVSYKRPTLGSAAPASPPAERRKAQEQGQPLAPMDNAARMGVGLSAGITLAASVIVGFLIGQWIDRHWNHSNTPWGTLVMSLAGVAAGFLNLFRILNASDSTRRPK